MRTDHGFADRVPSPFRPETVEASVREVERLTKEARGLALGVGPASLDARVSARKARQAVEKVPAILARLDLLRERLITAGDASAEIVREHEGRAA